MINREVLDYFFDPVLQDQPFSNGLDETIGYFSWLDMFIEYGRRQRKSEEFDDISCAETLAAGAAILQKRIELSGDARMDIRYGISISAAAASFGLAGYGFFCLLLALAPSFDQKYCKYFRMLRDDDMPHGYATLDMAEQLYSLYADENEQYIMRASLGLLQNSILFDLKENDGCPGDLSKMLDVSEQFVSLVKGNYDMDQMLSDFAWEDYRGSNLESMLFGRKEAEALSGYLKDGEGLLILTGKKGSGRHYFARQISDRDGLLYIDAGKLSAYPEALRELLVRAAVLNQEIVFDCGDDSPETYVELLDRSFAVAKRVIMLCLTKGDIRRLSMKYKVLEKEVPEPDYAQTISLWKAFSDGYEIDNDIEEYARKYKVPAGVIRRSIRKAADLAAARGDSVISGRDIDQSIMSFNVADLDTLGTKITSDYSWDDLILGTEQSEKLRLICNRIKLKHFVDDEWGFGDKIKYGKGLSVLLYGSPGTGKTMTAQVLAHETGMDLYRIDLSRVVDKYIGETQKNIGRIFDAAKNGNCILFFDEAESLFSKRTEVSSSNDKHANNETAYLLQKMEEFEGVSILATNRYADFDAAFVRRITYTVYYDKPDAEMRIKLFESIMPEKAKVAKNINYEYFAKKLDDLSGSNIKSVLYNAAFMAASENTEITNQHIARAIVMEYKKQGRMIDQTELLTMN